VTAKDTAGLVSQESSYVEVRAPDVVPPTIRILTPDPGATIYRGTNLTVQVEAGDDIELKGVTLSFDSNGDGSVTGTNETMAATKTGPFSFQAQFVNVSGASGPRMVQAVATDGSGNVARAEVPITLGGVTPVTQTLFTRSGAIPAQGSQWVGGRRQIVDFDPVNLPSAGTVTFVVTTTPNCRLTSQNVARYDPCVDRVTFNGKDSATLQVWNAPGSNPAICSNTFVATQGGALDFRILGAGVFNSWGEFDGSPAQSYTLEVQFVSVDNVDPAVTFGAPGRGANLSLGAPLTVDLTVTDNVQVASVLAFFDVNGDRDTEDPGETRAASWTGGSLYRTVFTNLTGPPGPRSIEALATDTSLNTAYQAMTVGIGGAGAGETVLFSRSGSISNIGQRQTIKSSPVAIPGVGRISMRVTATPPTRQEYQNLTRYDPAVWTIRFNGQSIKLTPECNPAGSDPAVCTSVWDSPGSGSLEFDILGPVEYNIWGEFTGHPLQAYTVDVLFLPGPVVTSVAPATGSVAGGDTVRVNGSGFGLNALVLFGEVAAQDVVRRSATELTCSTPPGVAGGVTVTVLNSDSAGLPWNYGPPYGLFGRLNNGFAYTVPGTPVVRGAERLLGTYKGFFAAVSAEEAQRQESHALNIPGAGRLRFEAWAFVPIVNPLPGPFENPEDLTYLNETTTVRGLTGGDGRGYGTTVRTTDISYPYGPVVSEATCQVAAGSAGSGRFTVKGPARWNAFWRQFGDFEMLSAPAQNWSLAVWFAAPPTLLSLTPNSGSTTGGTLITLTGTGFYDGIQVRFGGQLATEVKVISPGALTCRTPPGIAGPTTVETVLFEMTSSLAAAFSYADFEILSFAYPQAPGLPAVIHAWTERGKVYQLQRNLDLRNPAGWQNIGGSIAGGGGMQAFPDPTAPIHYGRAFYRLVQSAP
jgi:hypothetical protein